MKLYDYKAAPSPRRVRIFLAEKGIEVPTEQIDLRAKAQFNDYFRGINPQLQVPYLVLDDGTGIAESMAICRYFDAAQPEPNLFGRTPKEQALVEMWSRRAELDGILAVMEAFRNSTPGFKDHAVAGPLEIAQNAQLAERGRLRIQQFFSDLEARAKESPYMAGDRYTVADITALVAVDFAGWTKAKIPDNYTNAKRWYDSVNARPSSQA